VTETYFWKRERILMKRKEHHVFILDNYRHLWEKRKWNSSWAFGLEASSYVSQYSRYKDGVIYIPEDVMRSERKIICKVGVVWGLVNVMDATMRDGVIVKFDPFDKKDFNKYFKEKKIA
jgi:hypothetical protein